MITLDIHHALLYPIRDFQETENAPDQYTFWSIVEEHFWDLIINQTREHYAH